MLALATPQNKSEKWQKQNKESKEVKEVKKEKSHWKKVIKGARAFKDKAAKDNEDNYMC